MAHLDVSTVWCINSNNKTTREIVLYAITFGVVCLGYRQVMQYVGPRFHVIFVCKVQLHLEFN